MTTNDHTSRATVLLDTLYELNEANSTGGADGIVGTNELERSRSLNKSHADASSKRARLQAVFSSRNHHSEKKADASSTNSTGVSSQPTNNASGPSPEINDGSGQLSVVANLIHYTNAATPPVNLLEVPVEKSHLSVASSTSSSAKQFLVGRVRSRSKTDAQSVTDKSLFSKIFSKKSKKPTGTLISTTTKSIDVNIDKKRPTSLKTKEPRSIVNKREDEDESERNASSGSLSDTDQADELNASGSSHATRANSSTEKKSATSSNPVNIPTSDSQYYASMSSAPAGFSISYHKRPPKGNDGSRIHAALSRLQHPNKKGTTGESQLLSLFQDPKRTATQSPTLMSGTTRVKTFSGQAVVTRNNSSSDRPSTFCIRSSSFSPPHDADETFISDEEIYTYFTKCHTCYDVMPKSSKLVIFDTQLAVKKAFYALVYNGVRAAPLWDNKRQKFIGLLTITDFILILQKYYKEPHAKIEELEEHRIETWRDVLREYEKPLLFVRPNHSLYEALRILLENHVHRLPIIDPLTNNVVFILTHKRILRFFYLYIYDWSQPSFMSKTVEELKIGTYENLLIIEETATVIEALNIFVKSRVSALPVVDKEQKLVNIYSRFDVIGLVPDKSYRNLNMTITEALTYRKERFENVAKCYKHELLSTCLERIIKAEVHRLVIVNQDDHVIGVLSLSDLLQYVIIRPSKSDPSSPVFASTVSEFVENLE